MQRYIELLIEDLHEIAHKTNPSGNTREEVVHDDASFFKHIEDVENYLASEPMAISKITGVEPEQLPPSEKLNKNQQTQLAFELENFLAHFHFALDFPHKYPHHLRYSFIRNFWTEKHTAMQFGTSHIEFCDYEKENCPFPGYCSTCDEFENDNNTNIENYKDLDESELPF